MPKNNQKETSSLELQDMKYLESQVDQVTKQIKNSRIKKLTVSTKYKVQSLNWPQSQSLRSAADHKPRDKDRHPQLAPRLVQTSSAATNATAVMNQVTTQTPIASV